MAYAMTKQGSLDNCITYEFICDTVADMNAIENRYRSIGSVAIVLQGESEGLEVYIAGSDKNWNSLSSAGADSSTTGGLSIHICGQEEVDSQTGLPDIEEPDDTSIYLVPASETSGNLYEEYLYVNNAWEKFGAASINLSNYATLSDISGFYTKPSGGIPASDIASGVIPDTSVYAPIANPEFTGYISLGRKANTTVGTHSVAMGDSVTASGNYSHAEGGSTTASGYCSHAEGNNNTASDSQAHAEGYGNTASGYCSHAEGSNNTASNSQAHAEGYSNTASGYVSHAEGYNTTASGYVSHAEGYYTKAYSDATHAEGSYAVALFGGAHAEGDHTVALYNYSHAEGGHTKAGGFYSHAGGYYTIASGQYETAIGMYNKVNIPPAWIASTSYNIGDLVSKENTTTYDNVNYSYITIYECKTANSDDIFISSKWALVPYNLFVVGNGTADDARSNAFSVGRFGNISEGLNTVASGNYSHAEGQSTQSTGQASHAEGFQTTASAMFSHAEGQEVQSVGQGSHAEGQHTQASGMYSHAEGMGGTYTENNVTYTSAAISMTDHTEGYKCLTGNGQPGNHAEGYQTRATGGASHTEGHGTVASGSQSHAEGGNTIASNTQSHAEGGNTTASGVQSHSEGYNTIAANSQSHAEGYNSQALNTQSHAEGAITIASGSCSHAEGATTKAYGGCSHTEGGGTIAIGNAEHVSGKYNKPDNALEWTASTSYSIGDLVSKEVTFTDGSNTQRTRTVIYKCKTANSDDTFTVTKWEESGIYAEIIGNGTADDARSNARALDWDGNEYLMGDIYINCNPDSTGGTALGALVSGYESRISALEAEIASLRLALLALQTDNEVTLENGQPLVDEQGNLIEYDTPTT